MVCGLPDGVVVADRRAWVELTPALRATTMREPMARELGDDVELSWIWEARRRPAAAASTTIDPHHAQSYDQPGRLDARMSDETREGSMRIPRIGVAVAVAATAAMASVGTAGAHPSCWGHASSMFAMEGRMGEHSSSFDTPRLGLRNLARAVLGEDATMEDLGAFVADAEGYEIEACSS